MMKVTRRQLLAWTTVLGGTCGLGVATPWLASVVEAAPFRRAENGAAYFNKVEALALKPGQSKLVRRIAKAVFRPCCGNSALFQDCDHGSAMPGLLELAAANGLNSAEMLNLAKIANGFRYPREYVELALYFDTVKGLSWSEAPADQVLSAEFSTARGWQQNVHAALVDRGILAKRQQDGGRQAC